MVNLLKDTEVQKEKQKWSKVNIILNLIWIFYWQEWLLFLEWKSQRFFGF